VAEYARQFVAHAKRIQKENSARDEAMKNVMLVRSGRSNEVFGGMFPEQWSQPIVANTIDVVAQDLSESVGALPTFSAAGDSILDERKRSAADKLTKIVNYYAYASRLATESIRGADRMMSYGFLPVRVEPDYEGHRPHIMLDDPVGSYYERNRFGDLEVYTRVFRKRAHDLAALFPDLAHLILNKTSWGQEDNPYLEVIRWFDAKQQIMMLPERDGLVLSHVENRLDRIPVAIAERPSLTDKPRGAFDDVLWVWAAKAKLALLSMEAVQKSVEAPIALPNDVQEMAFGPDSILRSGSPEKIRRVPLELPQSAMIENRILDDELKFGSRFPDARAGQMDSSIVTGRGVQALMGGFDSRIKVAQVVLGTAITEALSLCLEMDERIWPDDRKDVSTVSNGTPVELRYTPARDIKGNYRVDFEYGVMAGLDPNRALVWSLQGLGAGLFSKSFVRRQLPVSMDVLEEEKIMDVEALRDSMLQSVAGYSQAIPAMASQGQDPQEAIRQIASVIDARKRGTPIEEAVATAFEPPEPDPEMAMGMPGTEPDQPMMQQEPGAQMAMPQSGSTQTMQQLLSGLRGDGSPTMGSRTIRQTTTAG